MDFSARSLVGALLLLSAAPAYASVFDSQWALENKGQKVCNFRGQRCIEGKAGVDIKYRQASARNRNCSAIIVAVLDSGVDQRHPDLMSNLLPGKNFVGETATDDPQDDNLHGTHVAGIIAGNGTEASGVVGVCRKARLLPVKVGNAQGFLTDADILEGINFAVRSGAKVVNGSFGGPAPDVLVKEAIRKARNTLFVFAAGNGDRRGIGFNIDTRPTYPASYELANIVTVAATDSQDHLGAFSNFGIKRVQLAAPGVNIMSALPMVRTADMAQHGIPIGSGPLDGTSMATPYVAGAAAMLWSTNTRLTVANVKNRLLSSVDKLDSLAGKVKSGGRLNLAKLMGVAR